MHSLLVRQHPRKHIDFGDATRIATWLTTVGGLSLMLGLAGGATALWPSTAGVMPVGLLLVAAGILQFPNAVVLPAWRGALTLQLIAVIYVTAGLVAIIDPRGSAVAPEVLIGIHVCAVGALRVGTALRFRRTKGWRRVLGTGLLSALLGALLVAQWPIAGPRSLEFLIPVELVVNGYAYVVLGAAVRIRRRRNPTEVQQGNRLQPLRRRGRAGSKARASGVRQTRTPRSIDDANSALLSSAAGQRDRDSN